MRDLKVWASNEPLVLIGNADIRKRTTVSAAIIGDDKPTKMQQIEALYSKSYTPSGYLPCDIGDMIKWIHDNKKLVVEILKLKGE
jgi:hypothetical protein